MPDIVSGFGGSGTNIVFVPVVMRVVAGRHKRKLQAQHDAAH